MDLVVIGENKYEAPGGEIVELESGTIGCSRAPAWKFLIKGENGDIIGRATEWETDKKKAIEQAKEFLKEH